MYIYSDRCEEIIALNHAPLEGRWNSRTHKGAANSFMGLWGGSGTARTAKLEAKPRKRGTEKHVFHDSGGGFKNRVWAQNRSRSSLRLSCGSSCESCGLVGHSWGLVGLCRWIVTFLLSLGRILIIYYIILYYICTVCSIH